MCCFSVKNECYVKLEKLIGCTSEEEERLLEGIMLFLSELYVNMGYVTLDESGLNIASINRLDALKQTLLDSILIILEKAYSDKPLETVGKVLKVSLLLAIHVLLCYQSKTPATVALLILWVHWRRMCTKT